MLSRIASTRFCAAGSRLVHTSAPVSQRVPTPDGPRDEANFPRRYRMVNPSPVRMGFIPEGWFDLLYSKTGVTGPYMLGVGLATFLVSKEIYVIEHEFYSGVVVGISALIGIKMFGPKLANALDDSIAETKEELSMGQKMGIQNVKDSIAANEVAAEKAKGQPILFQAKKENIGLQLEAVYRSRLQQVHQEVKKRLDYQLETSNVNSRFEQRHMVNWIVDNVRKSITPAQEAASLKQCISDLKGLAARA